MKFATPLLLVLATLAAEAAPTPLSQFERVAIAGRDYVRLSDWARANGFQNSWLSKEELKLANNAARLTFTVNSQRATVNGVTVWLSAPIAAHNGTACITPVDLKDTLHPLLWPLRSRGGAPLRLICLDPGHGGPDTGNREGKQYEKTYTLALALELAAQLRKAGFKTILTRSRDTFVELEDRPALAHRRGADLFISLHFNAAATREACGAEVYCLTSPLTASTNARGEGANTGALPGNVQNDRNVLLAYQLQRSLVNALGLEDRGVRRARWAVLRSARMPAVLVECGFMSNPSEARKIYSAAWRRQLAAALVDGVKNYQRCVDPVK